MLQFLGKLFSDVIALLAHLLVAITKCFISFVIGVCVCMFIHNRTANRN